MSKVFLDAGHGGNDSGAVKDGLREKDFTLEASLYIAKRFKELGITCSQSRTTDTGMTNDVRTKKVRDSKADICYSLHFNAGPPTADRVETIHSIHAEKSFRNLSENVAAAIAKVSGQNTKVYSRALPNNAKSDYYFMHRQTGSVRTMIVEFQFMDGPNRAKLKDKDYRLKMYEALVEAHCKFYGIKYGGKQPETGKPEEGRPFQAAGGTHKEPWQWAYDNGLIDGHDPSGNVSRAQLATILKRFNDLKH